MISQPLSLNPSDVRVLTLCPLHYHFAQQGSSQRPETSQTAVDKQVRETIQHLHTAGGPNRLSLTACLQEFGNYPEVQQMVENYYRRLEQDWPRIMAGNETMTLRINVAGFSLAFKATVDRLDKTSDGGILAILFQTGRESPHTVDMLRRDPATTIYHALVASTYPLKRPVRIQTLWLRDDQEVTVELGEDEYRRNLGLLREPMQALARGEVMARPGLHCDECSFKYQGCPVYARAEDADSDTDDFVPPGSGGKISPRKWIFKI